jgi:CheY-like chemotaxis protein
VQPGKPLVMIVDDSLTVRRITSRLLTREGFDVRSAKDGVDCARVLQTESRRDPSRHRDAADGRLRIHEEDQGRCEGRAIPIVMITSRTAEKHRNLARELGVELYLGKPFQEDELLRHSARDARASTSVAPCRRPPCLAPSAKTADARAGIISGNIHPEERTHGELRHHEHPHGRAGRAGRSGKTTLAEALLLASGAIKEAGTVERGTTDERLRSAREDLHTRCARRSCTSTRATPGST